MQQWYGSLECLAQDCMVLPPRFSPACQDYSYSIFPQGIYHDIRHDTISRLCTWLCLYNNYFSFAHYIWRNYSTILAGRPLHRITTSHRYYLFTSKRSLFHIEKYIISIVKATLISLTWEIVTIWVIKSNNPGPMHHYIHTD